MAAWVVGAVAVVAMATVAAVADGDESGRAAAARRARWLAAVWVAAKAAVRALDSAAGWAVALAAAVGSGSPYQSEKEALAKAACLRRIAFCSHRDSHASQLQGLDTQSHW